MTDKDLDNLVKNKLDSKEFAYEDAYWEHAEALLIAQRRVQKSAFWNKQIFYASTIALLGLLSWFLVSNKTKTTTPATLALQETKLPNTVIVPEANTQAVISNTNPANPSTNNNNEHQEANQPVIAANTHNNNNVVAENNTLKPSPIATQTANSPIENNSLLGEELVVTAPEQEENYLTQKAVNTLQVAVTDLTFENKNYTFLAKPEPAIKRSSVISQFNASAEVGVNSFNNTFASNSLGYFVGGRLYLDFGKLSFNTNLHFEQINQNTDSREYINKQYDFSSETKQTNITNQSIQYAIIGLNAMYPVYKNHSLGLGVQMAQLLQSNDKITTVNLENNTTNNVNASGYSSVLNKTDWQLSLNYQYRFTKNIALGVSYIYGLNDISKNEAFNTNKADYNKGLKLGIQYILK
ncbi:MAG: outer membrane beta-barrel protein [Bacteroidota bacterium]